MPAIDLIIVILFLLFTLYIGTRAARQVKDLNSYAVGERNYGSWALFATLSASFIGGGYTFGLSEKVFTNGFSYVICLFGFSLQVILIACFVAPRMKRFSTTMSTGDIMATFYGTPGRVLTGFASVLVCSGILGAQVGAIGYVFHMFLGIHPTIGILIGCGIVIAYSVYGGMKAVVATDILQFAILIVMIPITLFFGISFLGGTQLLVSSLPEKTLSFPGHLPLSRLISLFLSLLLGEALVPPYVQRLLIAKSVHHTKKGTLRSGILSVPFFFIVGCLGLVALVVEPTLEATMVLPFVINTVLPVGLKGLAIAGIVAVIMSSGDSYLNAAAIAIVHDIVKPLKRGTLSSLEELKMTRIATLIIGVTSVIFALSIESVLDVLLYSYNFWSPIILVPLVMGILGYSISLRSFALTVTVGIGSVLAWNHYFAQSTGFDGLVIGVFANLFCFVSCYLIETKEPTMLEASNTKS